MSIPAAFAGRSVYHFTPVANLPAILAHGLLSISQQKEMGLPLRTIVWETFLRYRAGFTIPVGPRGTPEDYIPFYFSKLSPMLLMVMSSKIIDEENIIHFEFPIHILADAPSVFSDAAIIPNSQPHFYTDPQDLSKLNWEAIDSPAWRMPTDPLRYARMSELLIHRRLPIASAARLIVWDSAMAGQVLQLFQAAGITPPRIETDPTCYFIASESPLMPAIRGPVLIYQAYQAAIQELATRINHTDHARFKDLNQLHACLQANLGCLPETAELVGLETDNRAHFEDIGAHTRRVVAETIRSPEYAALSAHDRVILEVAAYLHDIGKGPKSRWISYNGKQQLDPDHPVRALPMLRRILEEDLGTIDYPDAVLLCKLVVYHDIIGGILFSGRRIEELLDVFKTSREFNMLMGLGRADSVAINPSWNHEVERATLRQAVLPLLNPAKSP